MTKHIKAWNNEHNNWKSGPYSLEHLDSCHNKGLLLDAGCGGGKYAIPLRRCGFDVVGIDVSINAIKTAVERSASNRLDIEFLAANIYRMPFRDAYFDIIWCYGVLQHLLSEERVLAIDEFRRIMKKGGQLFIEVLGEDDMRYGGIEVEHNTFSRKKGIIYHYFNKYELNELLNDFSNRIIESKKEKRFDGKSYIRHTISVISKKL